MILKYRKSNIEIDVNCDHLEHELMIHYKTLHNKLVARCMKCMQNNIVVINLKKNVKIIVQVLYHKYIVILTMLILLI